MNKGEIWLVQLPFSGGKEQAGARPALILADTKTNVAIILPFTSAMLARRFDFTLSIPPSPKNGLASESVALIFQTRAIDKKRLVRKIGLLEESYLGKINNMLRDLLKL